MCVHKFVTARWCLMVTVRDVAMGYERPAPLLGATNPDVNETNSDVNERTVECWQSPRRDAVDGRVRVAVQSPGRRDAAIGRVRVATWATL